MANPLEELLLSLLPQEGQDTLLGTINAKQLDQEAARTSSGPITPMVGEDLLAQLMQEPPMPVAPSADNGFYIPEQAVSQADLDRMMQADWVKRAEAFRTGQASDPNKGWEEVSKGVYKKPGILNKESTSFGNQYTNVKDAAGVPTMTPPMEPVVSPENVLLGSNLAGRLTAIRTAPDSRTKLELYQQLQVDAAGVESQIISDIQKQAEIQTGVKSFEARVLFNEAKDKASPGWQLYHTDSRETAQARQDLDKARLRAAQEAQVMAHSNIKLNTLKTQVSSLKPLLDLDMRREDRTANREDQQAFMREQAIANSNLRKTEKEDALHIKLQEGKEAILSQTTPQKRARLAALDPTAIGKTDDELATMLVKGWNQLSKEDKAVIQAQPEQLLPMSLAGNLSAVRVLVDEEAARTKQPKEEIGRQLMAIRSLVRDPVEMDKTAQQVLGGAASPEYQQYKAAKLAATTMGAKEADREAFDQMKQALVARRIQGVAQSKWMGDMSSWQLTDPTVKAAYDTAATAGGSKDLITVARTALSQVPINERARVMDAFIQEIRRNSSASNSLLGAPNPDAAINLVQAEVTRSRWNELGPKLVKALTPNSSNMPVLGPLGTPVVNAAQAGYDWLFGDRK